MKLILIVLKNVNVLFKIIFLNLYNYRRAIILLIYITYQIKNIAYRIKNQSNLFEKIN